MEVLKYTQLLVLKPLHASWLIELFDHMTLPAGKAISLKGWEVAGITNAIKKGTSWLPSLDPLHDIDEVVIHTGRNRGGQFRNHQWRAKRNLFK